MIRYIFILMALKVSIFAHTFTLEELLEIAINNNHNIKIAKDNIKNKKVAIKTAKSYMLPQINITSELAHYDTKTALLHQKDELISTNITLNLLLFDFYKISNNINIAKNTQKASQIQLMSAKNSLALTVKKIYYDILKKEKLVEVAKEIVDIDKLQLQQTKEYFKAGIRTKIDVTNATLQLSNSKLNLLQTQANLKIAKNQFITILAMDTKSDFFLKKDTTDIEELAKNIYTPTQTLESLIKQGVKNRPEMLYSINDKNTAKLNLDANYKKYYPEIYLNSSYTNVDSDTQTYKLDELKAGIALRYNIFSGYKTTADIQKAKINLDTAQQKLEHIKLQIIQEIKNANLETQKYKNILNIQLSSLKLAKQNLLLATQRYKNGLNDMVELDYAKLQYTKNKNNLVNAYYDYKVSLSTLEYVVGN